MAVARPQKCRPLRGKLKLIPPAAADSLPPTATPGERAAAQRGLVTAEMPGFIEAPPTPGAEADLDAMSWEEASFFALYNPRIKATIRQLVPPYLGGRYAKQAVERLHKQVHPMYPIKQFPRWNALVTETENKERQRRERRTRHKALAILRKQEEALERETGKLYDAEALLLESRFASEQLRAEVVKLKAEAVRLASQILVLNH